MITASASFFFPEFFVSYSKIFTISHQTLSRNVLKLWVCKEHRDCVCTVWCIVHRVRIMRRFRIDWQKSCDIWPSAGKITLLSISSYHQNCLWLPPKRAPMSKRSLEYHHQLVTVFKLSVGGIVLMVRDYYPTCGWLLLSILTPNQDCVGLPLLTKGVQVDSAGSNHTRHKEGRPIHSTELPAIESFRLGPFWRRGYLPDSLPHRWQKVSLPWIGGISWGSHRRP